MKDIKVGDIVMRYISTLRVPMELRVTAIDEQFIHCGDWKFNRSNGAEVDEDLGWDGVTLTGSFIKKDE